MGASSSTDHASEEQKEVESLAAATGSLPMLRNVFSKLADPVTKAIPLKSLQDCFSLNVTGLVSKESSVPECFPNMLVRLGDVVVEQFFVLDTGGINWVEFLRGYIRCCGRMPSSMFLQTLIRLYAAICGKAGVPIKLEFALDDPDSKISGSLMPKDVRTLLWTCWFMNMSSKFRIPAEENVTITLPDINNLVLSAIESCSEACVDLNMGNLDISTLEAPILASKLEMWVLTTMPGLAQSFCEFIHDRVRKCATLENESHPSTLSLVETTSMEIGENAKCLLTCGKAWAIYLTLPSSSPNQVLIKECCPWKRIEALEDLLYRSSLHGKGLNRFWSSVEGYNAPSLILISTTSSLSASGDQMHADLFVIGILTQQGFESQNNFYGSSGYLYAISPIFHAYPPSGKEKNFVYSHLHTTGKVYDPHPKPVGIAFGGIIGNERVCIDEDFAKVIVRHHAVDKTYQPGPLIPNQGFLPTELVVLEVEVWGLGGSAAKDHQDAYKKREDLFSEQRRKVDLKTFSTWEESPEKMMMDMVGDPNRVQREDR